MRAYFQGKIRKISSFLSSAELGLIVVKVNMAVLISGGELNFKRKTLYIKHTDKLVLEKLIDVPLFPTSSEQVFCVEVFNRSSRRKMWQTSVPTLKVFSLVAVHLWLSRMCIPLVISRSWVQFLLGPASFSD